MLFTLFYLLLAILCNWLRHSSITSHLNRVKNMITIRRNSAHPSSHSFENDDTHETKGKLGDKDLGMDDRILAELATNKGGEVSQPTVDSRKVDENGQLVISNDKTDVESDNVSEAGEN